MVSRQIICSIVLTTIHNHPKDCVFVPGLAAFIAMNAASSILDSSENDLLEFLIQQIVENEIYCPHEGIDRRAEFGMV